jgi:hypothetical protein
MCESRIIFRFAGFFVMLSLALGWVLHPAWFLFTAFVGVNLFQVSFTGFCPLEKILAVLRYPGCRPRSLPG